MRKSAPTIAFVILCLIAAWVIFKAREDQIGVDHKGNPETPGRLDTPTGNPATTSNKGGIHSAFNQDPASRTKSLSAPPFQTDPEKLYSALVTADIKAGETLVMGGYRTPDGKHEFTLLTPSIITTPDGEEQIMLKSNMLSIGPEFAKESGMDSLTTPERTADGRAEAWNRSSLQSTMTSASQWDDTRIKASPSIISRPGEPFSIGIGQEGGPGYQIEATVNSNADGSFSIEALTERDFGDNH